MWRVGASLLALSVLAGCDEVKEYLFPPDDPEAIHFGTVAGVDACVKKSDSSVLSPLAAKHTCAAKHQRNAKPWEAQSLDGSLRFDNDSGIGTKSGRGVTLTVKNQSASFVATRIGIRVLEETKSDDKFPVVAFAFSGPVWVEPGATADVSLSLDKPIEFRRKGEHSFAWDYNPGAILLVPFEAGDPK